MRNVSRRRSKGEKKKMRGGEQNKVKTEKRNRTRGKRSQQGNRRKGDGKGYGVRMAKVTG